MLSTVHLFALLPAKEECELDEAVQEKEKVEDGVVKFVKEIEAEEKKIANLKKKAKKP